MFHDRGDIRGQLRRVAAALREHWDPIGGGAIPDLPANEYEGYAPRIVTLLREGADDLRIAKHLSELESGSMGLAPTPPERLVGIATAIRQAAEE